MDGFDTDDGIITIAATNRPDVLDPALLRPGRFDREIMIDLPDVKGREEILKVHARKVRMEPDTDLSVIARGTPYFSGADLEALINEAALTAVMKERDAVVLAISVDPVEVQHRFAETLRAPYRLLSDPDLRAVDAYGVRFEIRGLTLAGRSLFVVDRRGKLAHVDRSFGVPKSLDDTALLDVLEKLVRREIRAAFAADDPDREARIAFLDVLDTVARRDVEGLRALLLSPEADPAEMAGPLRHLPDRRPSVFDLVDPATIVVQADKAGVVEVSAPLRLEEWSKVAMTLKRTEAGHRLLALRVESPGKSTPGNVPDVD